MTTAIRNYSLVTLSYWGFTLTDGALRMLVLLHFHALGYHALELAFLFLLYEAMGVLTNLFGGWIGARYGLKNTLFAGLSIQIFALILLAQLPDGLTLTESTLFIMLSQALSGVAKDLTKMSSKSAIKVVVPAGENSRLFHWVSLLTGSKNALKGAGFFMGGFLLTTLGFDHALYAMAAGLIVILVATAFALTSNLGQAKSKVKFTEIFSKDRSINYLSAARIFLFASRDVWFVVGLPIFLATEFSWSFTEVGSFMAIWVIGYGFMQALVPRILGGSSDLTIAARSTLKWGCYLALLPLLIAAGLWADADIAEFTLPTGRAFWLTGGLIIFGLVFAVNSALHSYLIVGYSDRDKASLAIGFYYTANAMGRLIGTLLSGLVYQYAGLLACLIVSSLLLCAAVGLTLPLKERLSDA